MQLKNKLAHKIILCFTSKYKPKDVCQTHYRAWHWGEEKEWGMITGNEDKESNQIQAP